MLHAMNMHYNFWVEAIACSIYLINRTPTKSLKDITPEESQSGRKPNLYHLRIFGSIAYVYTPKQKSHKLDANSSPYIFVGYDENTKVYRVYDPTSKKVQVARDVCIAKNGVCDYSNVQDAEFSGTKIVLVEDKPPSLNPNSKEYSFIPPPSSDRDDNIVNTNDASTNH